MSKAQHVRTKAANRLRTVRDQHQKTSRKWFERTIQHATDYLDIAADTIDGGPSAKGYFGGAMALSVEAMATAASFYHDLYDYCRAVTGDLPGASAAGLAGVFFELDAAAAASQPIALPNLVPGDEADLASSDLVSPGAPAIAKKNVSFTKMGGDVLVSIVSVGGALQAGKVYTGQITRKSTGAFVSIITVSVKP